jgi:hypothetical protein
VYKELAPLKSQSAAIRVLVLLGAILFVDFEFTSE